MNKSRGNDGTDSLHWNGIHRPQSRPDAGLPACSLSDYERDMNNENTGGPAFPVVGQFDERRGEVIQYASEGMTLRDYFAARAMQTLLAGWHSATADNVPLLDSISESAYAIADAMLRARENNE